MPAVTIAPASETLIQIPIKVGGRDKLCTFKIAQVIAHGPASAADMQARGWEPVSFICERVPQNARERAMTVLAQRSARDGSFHCVSRG
jgi:hypothetical protein